MFNLSDINVIATFFPLCVFLNRVIIAVGSLYANDKHSNEIPTFLNIKAL